MKAVVFNINTKQPVLATSFQGDPNSDVSYDYIPGSVIRGALIGRYLKQNSIPRNVDIVSNDSIRSLFFDSTTRYLNAYLYDEPHRQRTLPSPLSWHKDKRSDLSRGADIYDLSQLSMTDLEADISPRKIGERFCSVKEENVWLFKEERRVNVHNQRDRRKGRAMEGRGRGEVFRYDALEAGQHFQAVILCDREEDAEVIQDLLKRKDDKSDKPLDLWLGGSQTAGYGLCQVQDPVIKENWTEIDATAEDRCDDRDLLTVHLLSDLMLRDVYGQHVVEPPTELLRQALDVELKLQRSFLASHYVGGFNRKWGLPLPQVQVTAAGSVFVYEPTGQVKAELLKELEEKGIGERCIDGFGRIAFNWLEESETFSASRQKPRQRAISSLPALNSTSSKLANDMASRLLRQKLDGYLLQEVNRYPISRPPTNSQLSRIMLTAQRALMQVQQESPDESEDELLQISRQMITQLLDSLPGNAKRQLEKAKISSSSLSQTLKTWIDEPDSWLTHPPNVEVAGITPAITTLLKQEYTLRLIMAVAKKAMKENSDD